MTARKISFCKSA